MLAVDGVAASVGGGGVCVLGKGVSVEDRVRPGESGSSGLVVLVESTVGVAVGSSLEQAATRVEMMSIAVTTRKSLDILFPQIFASGLAVCRRETP